MIALLVVRAGRLGGGALETARLADAVLLAGEGTEEAAATLRGREGIGPVELAELGPFAPARYARELVARLEGEEDVVLPASPDGRDLAPRLSSRLGRPLLAGAVRLAAKRATVLRMGGRQLVELTVGGPYVATYDPGRRASPEWSETTSRPAAPSEGEAGEDPLVLEVIPPDPAAMDLAEAPRILAVGAGAGSGEAVEAALVASRLLGASLGATRVVTDGGAVDHRRQIGTTGVSVSPRLYLGFGVSGAAQHVAGLGEPAHLVSVNTDPSCPMMAMADLAIVSDAPATLTALAVLLEKRAPRG